MVLLFAKYFIIGPKLSWPHTGVILTFLYRESTTDSVWKFPVFLKYLFRLEICILRALEKLIFI